MPTEPLPISDAPLAGFISVQRRFLRSVNLERDFYSPDPLDGYLLTASALLAFDRHAKALEEEQARKKPKRLAELFEDVLDDTDDSAPCLICNL